MILSFIEPERRSLAARQANQTRQAKADADYLRSKFSGDKREVWSEHVIPFLRDHTAEGERCGDLLGPGHSAVEMLAAGMTPLCCDDLSYNPEGWPKERRRRAAQRIASDCGVEFAEGPFADIVSRIATALYDPCGIIAIGSSSARDIKAAHDAGVRAMAVTVLLARVKGGAYIFDGDPENYLAMAETVVRKVAPRYRVRRAIRYVGEGTPMAVLLLCSGAVGGSTWRRDSHCAPCARERQREFNRAYYDGHPERRAIKNAKQRERYQGDAEYRATLLAKSKTPEAAARRRARYHSDADLRSRIRERNHAQWLRHLERVALDPAYAEAFAARRLARALARKAAGR